ncbi:MAG: imidazoleglycerol-phosphate dehydratase HisB [Ruminococcaceae bacterium]|nr:imidazoleglycerol-phosphate dehydratase HisB [Oscillospiraceae bacterium]
MRTAEIRRDTAETKILLRLDLDGKGVAKIDTGCGFLDHMLTLLAGHGKLDLTVTCKGDTQVDDHHTVEDVGIALGQAVAKALGDKKGITRYGTVTLPMDEALVMCALDLSGRCGLYGELQLPSRKVGSFDTELVEEFFLAFVRNASATVHFVQLAGHNTHHIIEGAFKAFGRALRAAVKVDPEFANEIPSTKGVL